MPSKATAASRVCRRLRRLAAAAAEPRAGRSSLGSRASTIGRRCAAAAKAPADLQGAARARVASRHHCVARSGTAVARRTHRRCRVLQGRRRRDSSGAGATGRTRVALDGCLPAVGRIGQSLVAADRPVFSASGCSTRNVGRSKTGALQLHQCLSTTQFFRLRYWGENRAVIKIGGASIPGRHDAALHRRSRTSTSAARIRRTRSPTTAARRRATSANAAAIWIEKGEHITIRNNVLHDSGNGLFVGSAEPNISRDILIEGNWIYDNGNVGSIYEHNTYTEAIGIIYQFNYFGAAASLAPAATTSRIARPASSSATTGSKAATASSISSKPTALPIAERSVLSRRRSSTATC